MVVKWDFVLVKAYDEEFLHGFPRVLVGCIFKTLRRRYYDREFIHVIRKLDSVSYSMHGLSSVHHSNWGDTFPPNHATPSSVYRECAEDHGAWIDTGSQILYYTQNRTRVDECMYKGIWHVFAGSNAIPRAVHCSEEQFIDFTMAVRQNYIKIACDSATVCLVDNGFIQSIHKVSTLRLIELFHLSTPLFFNTTVCNRAQRLYDAVPSNSTSPIGVRESNRGIKH